MALNKIDSRLLDSYTETVQATTSGTSIDFTDIPAGVKRITLMLNGVSTSGTSLPMVQIGDSGGIETTGYLSSTTYIKASSGVTVNGTTGFRLTGAHAATSLLGGVMTLVLLDAATNTWSVSSIVGNSATNETGWGGGSKALTGTLDRIRLTTVGGTDTFDAGLVNIMYG